MSIKIVQAAVDANAVAAVLKMAGDEATLLAKVSGIGKQFRSLRENITNACAAIVIDAAKRDTSKIMNALVTVIAEEKGDADARAVIAWATSNGFKKGTHPDTKKPTLDLDKAQMDTIKANLVADEHAEVSRLLTKPYHLSIAKANPFRDLTSIGLLEQAIKQSEKAAKDIDNRKAAGVKTNLSGLDDMKALLERLTGGAPAAEPAAAVH